MLSAPDCGCDVKAVKGGRSARNKTLSLSDADRTELSQRLLRIRGGVLTDSGDVTENTVENIPGRSTTQQVAAQTLIDRTVCGDVTELLPLVPDGFADLAIVDPPYNLSKNYNGLKFRACGEEEYYLYLKGWFGEVCRILKPAGSLYICGDWHSTAILQRIMGEHLTVMNRITWQREKGRGAKNNWKNAMEDIWFGVKDPDRYYFDLEAVKQKRRVLAPYRQEGLPRDWQQAEDGKFRLTCPSNFWDDISVPYWSMPENTEHPTQKPEKLVAKLVLASCPPGGVVFDPFLGSGTTSVVAKKLGRHFCGIEIDEEYCLLAEKRLRMAGQDNTIQGYTGGVFWERNTSVWQNREK